MATMNIKHDKVIPLPVPGTGPSQELAWKCSEEPEYLAAGAFKAGFCGAQRTHRHFHLSACTP